MKKVIYIVLMILIAVPTIAAERITFSIDNRIVDNGTYYADVMVNVASNDNPWLVASSTIVLNYNSLGLALTAVDGVSVLNIDSQLQNAGYICTQTNFNPGLSINLFSINPSINKTGNFRLCTVRWNITTASQFDSIVFNTNYSEIYNSADLALEFNCSDISCYKIQNPTPKILEQPTLPTLFTANITSITSNSASSGGTISSDGYAEIISRGVCWSISQNPTIANSKTTDGTGIGAFSSSITGLIPGTTYYVRAYATNSVGTAYGEQKMFTTVPVVPVLTTTAISIITQNSANSGGNISYDGGANITSRGVCWSENSNPTISDNKTTNGTGSGQFTSEISGLNHGTTYYVRAYATNSAGTSYGDERSFTTMPGLALLTTSNISNVTSNSAVSGGSVTDDGGASITARGVCWSISQNPTIANSKTTNGSGLGSFISNLTGLNPGTTYYVRAYATNSAGTAYGEQKSLTTAPILPTLTTNNVFNISQTSASSGGTITSDGGASVTSRGVCWSTSQNPTILDDKTSNGTGIGFFPSSISGLNPGTTYYIRAYATNSVGTAYGDHKTFTTNASLPSLTTTVISNITSDGASSGGAISTDGGAPVTARGVCWSTSQNPTIANSKTNDGTGVGSFISSITGLEPGTTYYVRAYATNSVGTAYGAQRSFSSLAELATITTLNMSEIGQNSASSGGNVTNDGGAAVTARGVCWSTLQNPTIVDSKTTDGTGIGSFLSNLNGLQPGTTYYLRAYATNSIGTAYGEQKSFTTLAGLAVLTTTNISSITQNSASSGGSISDDGGSSISARGVCWSTSQNPTIADSKTTDGSGLGNFVSLISGLNHGTTYYIRAYATNGAGTAYGEQKSFTTLPGLAVLTTTNISSIGQNLASSGGNISDDGGAAVTARGVCWSTSQNPTIANNKTTDGNGLGIFVSSISGLNPGTIYYVRAYATNSAGTAYGDQKSFTTSAGLAQLTTSNITSITVSSSSSGGNITSDGGATITSRGVCWSTSQNPTISNSKTTNGTGVGSFTSNISSLLPNTTYYVRAYATNSAGTAYGDQKTFTTLVDYAMVSTTSVTNIQQTTASSGGNVTYNGGAEVTARGVCWSTSQNPTIADNKTSNGNGLGSFTSNISGLTANTTYYVRAYATNSKGTAYGNQITFTSKADLPTVTSIDITSITPNSAISGGNVSSDGGAAVTSRGVCWSTNTNPTINNDKTVDGSGLGSFVSNLSGLLPVTNYYVRAYATNSSGTSYGEQKTFTTGVADAIDVPDSWDFADQTGNNANIVLPSIIEPKIGNRDFVAGDAIGFFYTRNGDLICGGYGIWIGNNLQVTAWGDNSQTPLIKDGFEVNEDYSIKVWDGQLGIEYSATATYSQGNDYYTVNGYSVIGTLNVLTEVTQDILVNSGWNIISTFVEPNDKNMVDIWNPIINDVTLVKNSGGFTFIPAYNINQIGDWNKYEGYQVYMNQTQTLSISGTQIKPEETPISLTSGWKIIPYLRNSNLSIVNALESLTNDNALILAKNSAGETYIPQYGINQIGNMVTGQGYQVYLSKNSTLTYPANSQQRAINGSERTPLPKVLVPEHKFTGNSAVLLIIANAPNGFEVGVRNSRKKLIGSGIFHNGIAAVTIWGNDEFHINNNLSSLDEDLSMLIYVATTGKVSDLEISDLTDLINNQKLNNLQFKRDAFMIANAKINTDYSDKYLFKANPNPFTNDLIVEFSILETNHVSLNIYNLSGIHVANLFDGIIENGKQIISFDGSDLASGEYTIVLTIGKEVFMRKIVRVR